MNKLKGTRAYLVGPMDYASDRGVEWRKLITPFLKGLGIGVFDPTNKASFGFGNEDLDHIDERKKLLEHIKLEPNNKALYDRYHNIMKEVVAIDLRMIDISDFIIAYINTNIYSCGTFHEIAMAVNQRKPVIVCCEQGKGNLPPWLFGILKHEMVFGNWKDVQSYISDIDSGKILDTCNRWRYFDYEKIFT